MVNYKYCMLAHEIFQYCQDLNKLRIGIGLEEHGYSQQLGSPLKWNNFVGSCGIGE